LIFIDSSAWISYFNGRREPVARRLDEALTQDERLCIADLVLTEVLQGFRRDRDFELARRTLAGIYRLPLSYATYINAARLYRRLRARGVSPKTVDCIIAQACLDSGAALLTNDGDFEAIARHSRLRLATD
jgi:predicted nucleic acid-binding protein